MLYNTIINSFAFSASSNFFLKCFSKYRVHIFLSTGATSENRIEAIREESKVQHTKENIRYQKRTKKKGNLYYILYQSINQSTNLLSHLYSAALLFPSAGLPPPRPPPLNPGACCNTSGNFNGEGAGAGSNFSIFSNFSSFSPLSTFSISSLVKVSYSISALVRSSSSLRRSVRMVFARVRASSTRRRTSASISCLVSEESRL